MKVVSFVGQLLNQVLARNLFLDLSIRAIHKLFAEDIQKLNDASLVMCFACLPKSCVEAMNL